MYFDDLSLQDWASSKGSSQYFAQQLASHTGSPFAEEKHQHMSQQSDFLGLSHSFENTHQTGSVRFWVRRRLQDKVQDMISEAFRDRVLRPGTASKLYGCLTFLNTGCYGKLGRAGLNAIKTRQHSTSACLTDELSHSLTRVVELLQLRPSRTLQLKPQMNTRFIAASDAAQHARQVGSAGALFVGGDGSRKALVMEVTKELFDCWHDDETKIAQLELCVVLMSMAVWAPQMRHHHGIWWVDNIAALMALVRGRSRNDELDSMAGLIHTILFSMGGTCFFEWVASPDNWADGISRDGLQDEWYRRHNFTPSTFAPPLILLQLPCLIVCRIFQFL